MRAICVGGEVEADRLGVMLPHEHVNTDATFLCQAPERPRVPIEEVPLGSLRRAPMDYADNLDMRDEAQATAELSRLAEAGGQTLVELTTNDLGRDPRLLHRVSDVTGINIIMATGYYVHRAHPANLAEMAIDQIADTFIHDIVVGVAGVRAGVIGEIGTGDPLDPEEARVVRAAGRAQLSTGCPINIHFAAKCHQVFPVLRLLRDEGVTDFSRIVISHMDVAIDLEQQREVAEFGAMVEYDTFGHESYPDSRGNVMPRDEDRVEALAQLHAWGLLSSVLISHDVCLKSLWRKYGGYGYTDLLERVRPMMDQAGLGADAQRQLFITNPSRVYAFLE